MDKSDVYLLLWCIDGVGQRTIQKLEEQIGDVREVLDVSADFLDKIDFMPAKTKRKILRFRGKAFLEDIREKLAESGIKHVTIDMQIYPRKLRNIADPPYVLFAKGDMKILDNFSIAVVGARRATRYGTMCAKKFSKELSENGITIVSGMAFGIDSSSHEASMAEKGKTVAVLGSSVDRPYPVRNIGLMENIIMSGGAVISEYPPGTEAIPGFFPMRNRIISGISDGVLIVEAAKKSGAIITVDYALEQGKNVFSVPGNINSAMSEGTNELIKFGAKPVTCSEDILEEYGEKICICKKEFNNDIKLSDVERRIVEALKTSGNMHADVICAQTGICIKDVLGVLNILQIKGIVIELGSNIYSVKA